MAITLLQEADIEDKISNVPDSSYEIGLFIGSILPFAVLVLIAYLIYNYNKKKNNAEN